MPTTAMSHDEDLSARLELAFRPLHKRAFGIAVGLAAGLAVFGATAIVVLRGAEADARLGLLAQYFAGYAVTWKGAVIGFGWAAFVGFIGGWFYAFCRNLVLAVSVFFVRARADLGETRDFLDHI